MGTSTKLILRTISIFVLILTCGLIACRAKTKKISVGYVSTGLTGLAVQVMRDLRLPEKYGLQLDYHGVLDPSSLNHLFLQGEFDLNLAAGVNVIALARSQGYQVQYFFPSLLNSVSLIVKKDSPYNELSDLRGHKIGWYGLPSGGGTAFYVLAKKKGINILRDYELIQSNPSALQVLLEKDDVQAIITYEPFVTRLLASNEYRSIMGPFYQEWKRETGFKMEMSGFAAQEKWISQNMTIIAKMIDAWRETVHYIRDHSEAVLAKYPDYTNLKSKAEISLGVKCIPEIFCDDWENLDQSINVMLESLAQDSVLISRVPANTIIKL